MAIVAIGAVAAWAAPVGYGLLAFNVATTVASYLFAPKMPNQYGPRLGDLKVQSSAYGNPIPIVYGAARIAGNMIWAADIVETAHTTTTSGGGKGGGGGGGSVTQTNYTYSQSFAISICEGDIAGIRKIWANGKLIYNLSDTADVATIISSNKSAAGIRIYTGSETQTADSLIQAHVGAADTPAYRGTAYIVFENLQLEAYGNRTPNLEFEVVDNGSSGVQPLSVTLPSSQGWVTALYDGVAYYAASLFPQTIITSYDGVNWSTRTHQQPGFGFPNIKNMCRAGGRVLCAGQTGGTGSNYITYSDDHGVTWTYNGATGSTITGGGGNCPIQASSEGSLVVWGSYGATLSVSTDRGMTFSNIGSPCNPTGIASIVYGAGVFVIVPNSGTTVYYSSNGLTWIPATLPYTGPSTASFYVQESAIFAASKFVLVEAHGKCFTSTNGSSWVEHDMPTADAYFNVAYAGGTFLAHVAGSSVAAKSFDAVTWEAHNFASAFTGSALSSNGAAFFAVKYLSSTFYFVTPEIITQVVPTLDFIVSNICTRAGLTAGQIDVTALTDEVHGYIVQRGTARSQLEQLMQAFYFDAVESDGKVKFVKRGGASAVSIPEDDLAAHEYGSSPPDTLVTNRRQEMELPVELNVQYMDSGAAYAVGSQYSQRLTTESENKSSLNFAIAMTATKAKQIADVLMYDAWTSRMTFDLQTGWEYSYLEPTDIITVTKGGRTYVMRIVDEDFSITSRRQCVLEDTTVYTQSATAAGLPAPGETVASVPLTNLMLLDIPLLRDADDGYGFYAAACGYGDGWTGAQPFKSNDDGATWTSYGSGMLNEATIGTASNALGDFTQNIFDELNSVTVVLLNGELASDTEINILNGANVALIGDEIIQFRDATLTATNTYALTGLLRGRQGTEWARSTHSIGDRFVLLTTTTTYPMWGAVSEYDLDRKYRGVSFGGFLDDATTITFQNTAVQAIPYSPVHLGGGRNAAGDLTLNWIRRTRISGGWNNYSDVPLGEATEAYVVEIYDDSAYTTVVRTITGITSATTSYSAADQTTDFGAPQATVYWKAYQVSATVGNGYEARGVI